MKTVQDIINAMTDKELEIALNKRKEYLKEKYPSKIQIITVNEIKYRCTDDKELCTDEQDAYYYLESLQEGQDDWVQVESLSDLTVWEYNELVSELRKHYPDYPIEYLEGRFV